ncbi:MAG: PfkB family carbohydrate kinase [Candidatus Methylacidiphilales bacterium]|nr:PfkB family carbohydrate kinase [Candidatus Methylacidiphilales bacterium]
MSVLIVGSVALDDIKTTTAEHRDLLGGSASYASVAASFYTDVCMVGIVGNDFPEVHREIFRSRGINIEGLEVADGKTFRWSGEYEEDMNNRRTISVDLNVFEHFSPKIPAKFHETPYVLLANIAPSLQSHVLDQIKSPRFVVADTMDLWISLARPDLLSLIKRVDMLILNDSEARQLTGERNAVKAGRKILELGPRYVVVKKGEHGALLFGRDSFFATGAFPLEDILDPTGAGDCFAGALIGQLAKSDDTSFESIKKAVIQGTLTASFNVEAFSLKRLERLTREEIDIRHGEFSRYISVNGAH